MAIDFDAVLNLGNDYFVSSNFIDAIGIPEDGIRLLMDDRPEVWLTKGSSFSFFLDAKKRYDSLSSILQFDFEDQLKHLVAFINGETDELINFNYSLYPIKTDFDFKKFGTISLVQLSDTNFESFIAAHTHMFGDTPHGMFPERADNFPPEYRLLVATEVKAERLKGDYDHHLFFDKLHDIYRSHNILLHCLQHFSGNYAQPPGSISSDSFPNAGTSGASKFRSFYLSALEENDFKKVEDITKSLEQNVFYRLLIGSEIPNIGVFSRLVFLRSILDPFFLFTPNDKMIKSAVKKSGKNKTEIQADLLLKSLAKNNARFSKDLSTSEVTQFLAMRNSFIHPSPAGDISTLHVLYDKQVLFRRVVYEFVFTTFLHNITNNKNLFAATATV